MLLHANGWRWLHLPLLLPPAQQTPAEAGRSAEPDRLGRRIELVLQGPAPP